MSAQIADYIEAPNSGGDYRKVLLVVHVTISPETEHAARGVIANWNKTRTGSTQYVVDNHEIIQAVPETAYAWAAGTTANKAGIHVEHVGYLQSVRQWRDGYSTAELELSAPLFAELGAKYGIPLRRIDPNQIRKAVASGNPADGGICGHVDITHAFPGETTHTDPGAYFPWDRFMRLIHQAANQQEDDMPAYRDWPKEDREALVQDILNADMNMREPRGSADFRGETIRSVLKKIAEATGAVGGSGK